MREVLRETLRTFSRRGGRVLGGAIAFYSLMSIAPMLVIAIHIAGVLTTESRARDALSHDLARWIGPSGAHTIASMLTRTSEHRLSLGSVLSVALLIYASTRLFGALEFSLHQMWGVQYRSTKGISGLARSQLRKRSYRFAMVLIVGVILVALVIFKSFVAATSDVIGGRFNVGPLFHLFELAMSFAITTGLFYAVFRVLPDVRIANGDLALGALITALLFTLGSSAIGLYIGHKGIESTWGAAGSIVMLMLWVHYSAQIFFLGVAFTGAHAAARGRPIQPNEHTIAVRAEEVDDALRHP
jgi:membrane protein